MRIWSSLAHGLAHQVSNIELTVRRVFPIMFGLS